MKKIEINGVEVEIDFSDLKKTLDDLVKEIEKKDIPKENLIDWWNDFG